MANSIIQNSIQVCRTPTAFIRTNPPETPKPNLDERFGLKSPVGAP
jgi:hypothetical protein